ncbi:hypothetical protein [Pseudodesulfovibrio sediminis]|nr:hypothetical protein [Pseudodesulfovibrio sediminis]
MTAVVRQSHAAETARSFGENPTPKIRPRGWWVLACGDMLDESSIEQRDITRNALLRETRLAGIVLPENIWVWDEDGVAQLVISTVPSLERAQILAERLKKKGLTIRIKRETF